MGTQYLVQHTNLVQRTNKGCLVKYICRQGDVVTEDEINYFVADSESPQLFNGGLFFDDSEVSNQEIESTINSIINERKSNEQEIYNGS